MIVRAGLGNSPGDSHHAFSRAAQLLGDRRLVAVEVLDYLECP